MNKVLLSLIVLLSQVVLVFAKDDGSISNYNVRWIAPSQNSSESMPCGGHDVGLNVWVEDGHLFFYMAQSGTFDENNSMLKLGRIRLDISPNPFTDKEFSQTLRLEQGDVVVKSGDVEVTIWGDVFSSDIHVNVNSKNPVDVTSTYESWRFEDFELRKWESFQNSYKWAPPAGLKTKADNIGFQDNKVLFYHQNTGETIFDATVKQQGMETVKERLFNPLKDLIFGGTMWGQNMIAGDITTGLYCDTKYKGWQLKSKNKATSHHVIIALNKENNPDNESWKENTESCLQKAISSSKNSKIESEKWWSNYWDRSYIKLNPNASEQDSVWQVGCNYQLFRYMLGCNAYGDYPTKFNGGLFTVDPVYTNDKKAYTPDFRNWGGGTFTAQNQRLVYFPMLKSGDVDMMKPQWDFYKDLLGNAELRSEFYWNHKGACFTEQIENFGLPNCSEYGWKRPVWYDKGMQYNAWLEYQWDTALEFCFMILQARSYNKIDIKEYIPMIESCLTFYDEHYQKLASQRGSKSLDGNGKLVLYPGSSCETYKMAYNATSTVAALQVVTRELLNLPEELLSNEQKNKWSDFQKRIPPISITEENGEKRIAPAKLWERVNNTEVPQLYPVFPWGLYGVGQPDLETAIHTFQNDSDAIKFRSHVGWKQDNIFAARLGFSDEAAHFTSLKLKNSERRFPAFWGPGFDWVPDHNWGGSGMIGLQEMLLQTNGDEILLFPAWPKEWNVHFKLHAPGNTTVEAELKNGKVTKLIVEPASREADVVLMISK